MIYSQKSICDYLVANPLGVAVAVGDVDDTNGDDYIFLDFTDDTIIGSDDKGVYLSHIQITIATRDWRRRKVLVDYVKAKFNVLPTYEKSDEFEYYLARCQMGLLVYGNE